MVLRWLSVVNVILVLFNIIPGYPMDGGRILRALIWQRTGSILKATFITTRIGVAFSWVLVGIGMMRLFAGDWSAFLLFVVGLFLKSAAESGYTNTLYHEVLAGVRIRDMMTRNPVCIPASKPLSLVVDEFFFANHHVAYPVIGDDGEYRGMLRLEYLKELPREKWPWTTAGDLAAEHDPDGACIDGAHPAEHGVRRLLGPGHGRLAVVGDGKKVEGIITRHDVLAFITIHTELN
jgi:CBS domain-containing protein